MVNDFNINRMNPYQVNSYVNRITGALESGVPGQLRQPIVTKNPINTLYNTQTVSLNDIAQGLRDVKRGADVGVSKAVPYVAKGVNAAKWIGKNAPLVGDVYDIYSGGKKVLEGNTGLGLSADAYDAITKWLGDFEAEETNQQTNNQNNNQTSKNTNNKKELPQPQVQQGGYVPIEQIIASAGGGNQVPTGVDDVDDVQQPTTQQQATDIAGLLQAYQNQQQQLNQPYVDALQNYLDNYSDYMKGSRRAQRFYTALAGLSGNAGYRDLAKQYDPAQLELNRINLVKALQEAKAGNVGNINEIIGNATIAQAMGLSPEAALANKNLLNAFTAQQKAQYGLQGRMYGADQAYNARVYEAELDNATRRAIANGRIDLAYKLQNMKGNTATTNALINAASFGATPEDVQAMLNYFGAGGVQAPARGLTQQGTAQPTKKQVDTVGGLFGD